MMGSGTEHQPLLHAAPYNNEQTVCNKTALISVPQSAINSETTA